jgi:hypothetical protein
MFENRVLRSIFGPKRYEVTGEWRRLHNKEIYDLYSPNIVQVIKSRRIGLVGHVACMGEVWVQVQAQPVTSAVICLLRKAQGADLVYCSYD